MATGPRTCATLNAESGTRLTQAATLNAESGGPETALSVFPQVDGSKLNAVFSLGCVKRGGLR